MDAMSATERYEDDIRKATQLYQIAKQNGSLEATKAMLGAGIGSGILPDGNPLGLHLVMFQPTLMGQGTLDQQAKWLGKAWNLEIIGNVGFGRNFKTLFFLLDSESFLIFYKSLKLNYVSSSKPQKLNWLH